MQIFRPRTNVIARSVLIGGGILPFVSVGVTYAFMNSSYVTGQDVILEQPVPFSHKHHVRELGIGCIYCHTGVEISAFAGVPPTHICMTCHSQIWTNAALLGAGAGKPGAPSPNSLEPRVYLDHSVHLAKGVGCSTCHGRIDETALTAQGKAPDNGVVPELSSQPPAEPSHS